MARDNRGKIFNIILKNIVLNKEIKLTNPDNLVNLIHIDKLIEYINRFVNSSKKVLLIQVNTQLVLAI